MEREQGFTKSIWTESIKPPIYPKLTSDLDVDVAIIGGGITGISAAYILAAEGKTVAVLEAFNIAKGSTAYSTGNLYIAVGEKLHTIQSKHGKDRMNQVLSSRNEAINFIEHRIIDHDIKCGFERVPWNLFTTTPPNEKDQEVEDEFNALHQAGLEAINVVPMVFPFSNVSKITTVDHQAQMNPYQYTLGLAKSVDISKCSIYENTKVLNIEEGTPCIIHSQDAIVTAKKVIMATHSPKGIYEVNTEMEAYREFAIAVKLNGDLPMEGIYWHSTSTHQYSVRPYANQDGNFLIAVSEPYQVGTLEGNAESLIALEQYVYEHFDVESIVYRWAAQNYKSADGLPYIGTSPMQSNIYIATGFKDDGLVYGTLAAIVISDLILGRESDWSELYDPKRFTPIASAEQFIRENVNVFNHLLKDYWFYGEVDRLKQIEKGEGKTLTLDNEKVAAYRDYNGELHIVSAVCTHLGCILHFNDVEKSWDCPCHGSRFTVDGEVIEGPAYENLARPSK